MLVKKALEKWIMCFDYIDLIHACPKDLYPLPTIDKRIDNSIRYKLLSFMDAYSSYNQIPTFEPDKEKTTFMIE